MFRFPALLFLAGLAACQDTAAPRDNYALPPPDPSLDTAALQIGVPIFVCRQWQAGRKPTETRVLVDVFFGRRGPSDPPDRPLREHLAAVSSVGGNVLHTFHFPAVRARIDTDRIPDLDAQWPFVVVHEVPDPRRYDWIATVGYGRPLQRSDIDQFIALGGRILHRFDFINALAGELPDNSIAVLRAMEQVDFVEASGQACLAAAPSPLSHDPGLALGLGSTRRPL